MVKKEKEGMVKREISGTKVMRAALLPHVIFLLALLVREGLSEPGILIEDQDLPKAVSRLKRSSGLVGGGAGLERVGAPVGEEERSVVGCGEVVLACPTTTMIVVREDGGGGERTQTNASKILGRC